jgi:TolB protein
VLQANHHGDIDVVIVDLRSGDRSKVLNNEVAYEFGPAWSPDGHWIAFASDRGTGELDIYIAHPDGGELTNLTQNDVYDAQPAWSPDGEQLAFQSDRAEPLDNYDLWTMDRDGGDTHRLTHRPVTDGTPAWSPDGHRIVFVRGGNLFTIRPDGSDVRQLYAAGGSINIEPDWQALN